MSSYRQPGDGSFVQFRPEIALRRARDMKSIGNMHEACAHLYEVLTSKRMGRYWNAHHEEMMVEFINLCTELRETRRTKDGLYFYRQMTQMQNPASLEKIVHYMIDTAQKKAAEARARLAKAGEDVSGSAVEDLEDEEEQRPESLLMGAVTSEGAHDRMEREVLVPWLRHVWDTYRNVLENIRYVPRLEGVYHATVVKAMGFCKTYNRTTEFRKLCGMLRNHLAAQRRSQEHNMVAMTQEQIERHLTTRFTQLEHCAEMSLWTEGFRTVEDIYLIMSLSESTPKAQLMATYYEKLSRIFWVSENYLFHAYAWFKFFSLTYAQFKALTEADKRNMASAVVLAALAIPVHTGGQGASSAYNSDTAASGAYFDPERNKKARLADLLKHNSLPSREALLAEICSKNILKLVRPEVVELYRLVEGDFCPLSLVHRATPTLAILRAETGPTLSISGTLGGGSSGSLHSLSQYVPNLEKLCVFRTLQQLSSAYSVFKLDAFKALVSSLSMSFHLVEKLVVRAVKNRTLAVRINHREGILRLGDDAFASSNVRRQLSLLAARLQLVADAIATSPSATATTVATTTPATAHLAALSARRAALFDRVRESMEASGDQVAARREAIERRKVEEERQRALDAERARREHEAMAAMAAAPAPIVPVVDPAVVAAKQMAEQQEKERLQAIAKRMKDAGMDAAAIKALTSANSAAMLKEADERVAKAKEDEQRRKIEQGERVYALARALREVERTGIIVAGVEPAKDAKGKALKDDMGMAVMVEKPREPVISVGAKLGPAALARYAEVKKEVDALNKEAAAAVKARNDARKEQTAILSRMAGYAREYMADIEEAQVASYTASKARRIALAQQAFIDAKLQRARARREENDTLARQRAEAEKAALEAARIAEEQARQQEIQRRRAEDEARKTSSTAAPISSAADEASHWRRAAPSQPVISGPALSAAASGGSWRDLGAPANPAAAVAQAAQPISSAAGSSWMQRRLQAKAAAGSSGSAAPAPTPASGPSDVISRPSAAAPAPAPVTASVPAPSPAPAPTAAAGGASGAAAGGGWRARLDARKAAEGPAPAPSDAGAGRGTSWRDRFSGAGGGGGGRY